MQRHHLPKDWLATLYPTLSYDALSAKTNPEAIGHFPAMTLTNFRGQNPSQFKSGMYAVMISVIGFISFATMSSKQSVGRLSGWPLEAWRHILNF